MRETLPFCSSLRLSYTNTSPYPDEVIDRLARAFYPAILACWNSEEGQRSLVGARPLHLACARPFGRLKAPLGLSLLRCAAQTRACLWQAEQAHHSPGKEKQGVPDGERPVVHIAVVCGFNCKFYKQRNSQRPVCDGRVRPIQGAPCFCVYFYHHINLRRRCHSNRQGKVNLIKCSVVGYN